MEEFFDRLNKFHKKYSKYFFMLLLIAAVFLGVKALPYVVAVFLPFIIGWIISFVASPLVRFLKKKLHIPYKAGAVVVVLLLLTLFSLLVMLLIWIVSAISNFVAENWEHYFISGAEYMGKAVEALRRLSDSLPVDVFEILESALGENFLKYESASAEEMAKTFGKDMSRWLGPFAGNVATGTISIVKGIPDAVIFAIMLVLSTFFFTGESEKITALYHKVPESRREKIHIMTKEGFGAIGGWIKAQFVLSGITAAELFIGFLALGIESPFVCAVIIAIIDLLPVLGAGTVLIPWAVINLLIGGSIYITIGLIILYFICLSVRNLLQPKILSDSIGLNPIVSLMSIWVGLKLYGFIGMILVPVFAMLVYKFYELGLFDWFFKSSEEEK